MSEQSEALMRVAVEGGLVEQPSLPAMGVLDETEERPDSPWVALPVDGRQVSGFARELGAILGDKGFYRFKNRLVRVEVNALTGRPETLPVTPHGFRSDVEKYLTCFREAHSRAGVFRIKMTMEVTHAQTCLEAGEFLSQIPRLLRVNSVRLPITRGDGRIELLPHGYDAASCILTLSTVSWDYEEGMTPDEAVKILQDLVREFPFQDARSKAVFFAAMVSQFGYFLQPLHAKRVNFLMHSNSSRSGKTLLVEILLTVAWGFASVDAMPDDAGKLRDRLDTAVLGAAPYVVFDDLEMSFLRSGLLNSFMSASWWSGRRFHSQDEFNVPKSATVFFTGNNLEVTADIAGRTLICDLFTAEADAQERKIEREFDAEWIRKPIVHKQLCEALWALIRAWRDGDRAHAGKVLKGYGEWSALYCGIVMHAGLGDPCAAREADGYGSTEYADMREIITKLAEDVEKAGEFRFEEIVAAAMGLSCFGGMLDGKEVKFKDSEGDRREFELTQKSKSAFGKLLGRYGGKVFVTKTGKKVVFDKRGKNRQRMYLIEIVGNVNL